jgi:acetyl-CoA C-acetyltransferase
MNASIIGWSHSKFGRLDTETLETLIASSAMDAIEHAGVEANDVDAIYLGHFNAGMVPDAFASSLVLQAHPALRFKPATRVENACASGAAALYQGMNHIESGRAKVVLVLGVEKMTGLGTAEVTTALARAAYSPAVREEGGSFPGIFARYASAYFGAHGDHSATLARIAAKNHSNGVVNPYAHMRKDLGFDFCNTTSAQNPIIAAPLRKTDCSLVSDGAAALVLASDDIARSAQRAVRFRSAIHVNDFLPMARRDLRSLEGAAEAWRRALSEARLTIKDLDFAEVHDCFTIAELMIYEAMGLAQAGRGSDALSEGIVYKDGKLPINASGGLKAKGHPVGATGVSMHAIAAMQLTNAAGAMQLPRAELGAVFNMGGSSVANYVSVLERTH